MDSDALLNNLASNKTAFKVFSANATNSSEEWTQEQRYEEYLQSIEPSPWSSFKYLLFMYMIGVACFAISVNCRERYRAAFIGAFCAIGVEVVRYTSTLNLNYAVKDTILKGVIIHCLGSVVMVLREKFVLTDEQKRLPWGRRAIATYKTIWNGRFVGTSRPAPVYHLLKKMEQQQQNAPSAVVEEIAEKVHKEAAETEIQGSKTEQKGLGGVPAPHHSTNNQGVMPQTWNFACKHAAIMWRSPRLRFLIKSAAHVALIIFIDNFKDVIVQRYLRFGWADVADHKRGIVRRYFRGDDVAVREAVIRAYFAFEGLWGAYNWYSRCHLTFAIFFVGIGFDEPEEWPPVFGDIRQGWNVRRFWSKYFDRIIYRTINGWGEIVMELSGLGRRPYGSKKRWVLNGLVFALSAFFHAYTDHLSGIECGFWAEMAWWMGNYVVIVFETAFLWALQTYCPRFYNAMSGKVGKTIGFSWVFYWMWWSSPKNQFPAIKCMSNMY